MILVTFLLLSYGITNIAIFGSIFESWRNFCKKISPSFFGKLFSCPMCLSTWVGFTLSYTLLTFGFDAIGFTPKFVVDVSGVGTVVGNNNNDDSNLLSVTTSIVVSEDINSKS